MPAGVLSPVNLNMPDWSRVRGQTKDSPGPPGWGFGVGRIIPPCKKSTRLPKQEITLQLVTQFSGLRSLANPNLKLKIGC